jgi:hypothetical protein
MRNASSHRMLRSSVSRYINRVVVSHRVRVHAMECKSRDVTQPEVDKAWRQTIIVYIYVRGKNHKIIASSSTSVGSYEITKLLEYDT